MEDKVQFSHSLSLHLRGIKELHKVSNTFFPILTIYCIFNAITPYATVFFSAQLLKELAILRRAEVLWRWALMSVIVIGMMAILKALLYRRYITLLNDLYGRKDILFIHKMFDMDFSEMDKQENSDLRSQIQQNENWSGRGLMEVETIYEGFLTGVVGIVSGITLTIGLFTSKVPTAAGKLTLLNNPLFIGVFAVMMIGVSIPAGKLTTLKTKAWSQCGEEATFGNRLFSHFGFVGMEKERSVDIRMNDQHRLVEPYFKMNTVFGADGSIAKMFLGKLGITSSLGASVATVVTGFIYVFTCLKAWGGAFDVGSITQYVGAASAMATNVYALTSLKGSMETNTPYLEKTFTFLDIPNGMAQGSLTVDKRVDDKYEVEFKDVSFKYPGSTNWSLRHVNMKFKVGERLAMVGENGSGKTTFIKLLCRLYDPQEGGIYLNGIDIREYKYDEYMNIFSVVFQDFQLISQTLGSNVAGSIHYDKERVYKALKDAGFSERLESMEKGLDTILYKGVFEDGVEISGGEAQKIAIARALYKGAPFIILDEPTAALDPIAEAEIYSKFDEMVTDKTAIYISHRLSSCKFCDEIVVFHEGMIIQQGSHDELVSDKMGKYYELWNAQAQYYTEN
ncbi:MAG: ABC transporter ATP-binding protein [Erysipelotrichaceae bacterium]|nr:ABC transporter ATP-binding protein [Erysipelotrichaceae bacterium]